MKDNNNTNFRSEYDVLQEIWVKDTVSLAGIPKVSRHSKYDKDAEPMNSDRLV